MSSGVDARSAAVLEVRALPWKPPVRIARPQRFRDRVLEAGPIESADDLGGVLIGFAIWVLVLVAAPVLVVVLAGLLFSVELPLVLLLAAVLVVLRFLGVIPWTVLVVDVLAGDERRETYRSLLRARRRIREINDDQKVRVRWAWT